MKLNQLLTIKSIICLIVGITFALTPGVLLAFFGVPNIEPSGLFFMTRLYGAMLVFLGLLLWFARNLNEQETLRIIVPPVAVGDAFCFFVALQGFMAQMLNDLGGMVIAFHFLSMVGLLVAWFPKRASQSQMG